MFTIIVKPRKGNVRTESFESYERFVSSVHAYRFSGIDIETSEVVPHYYAYPAPVFRNAPRQKRW